MNFDQLISFLLEQPFNRSLGDCPVSTIISDIQAKTGNYEIEAGDDYIRCGIMLQMINEKPAKNYGEAAKVIKKWAEKIRGAKAITI